jgi:hypothetical protein
MVINHGQNSFMVRYLIVTDRKGISSYQLAKELGITQKSSFLSRFIVQKIWYSSTILIWIRCHHQNKD